MRTEPTNTTGTSRPDMPGGMPIAVGLSQWATALAAATDAAPVHAVIIGDSIANPTMPSQDRSWPRLVAQTIATRQGIPSPTGPVCAQNVTTPGGTNTGDGAGGKASALAAGQTLAHQIGNAGACWIVYTSAPGAGTLEVRNGAGGPLVATINAAGTAHASRLHQVTGLPTGYFDTCNLHLTAVSGPVTVEMLYPGREPALIWPAATIGSKTSDHTANPALSLDLIDTLETGPGVDLVIIATGTNDPLGTYPAGLTALIDAIQARTTAPLAVWVPFPGATYTPARTAEQRSAAYATGWPVLDSSHDRPATGDGIHPSIAGTRQLAAQLGGLIAGDPLSWIARQAATQLTRVEDIFGTTYTETAPNGLRFVSPGGTNAVSVDADKFSFGTPGSLFFGQPDGYLRAKKVGLLDGGAVPAGPNNVGDLAVVSGTLRICTVAGSPGTWVAV